MTSPDQSILRRLPSVDALLGADPLRQLVASVPHVLLVDAVRAALDEARQGLLRGGCASQTAEALHAWTLARALDLVHAATRPHFRRAINATGIILHTALGRAVLAARALDQIRSELAGYSVLQVDVETGKRSRRDERIEWLLQRLTGAPAATVVNNNAAATMLVLNTIARGRQVIVSRGQLVEIGGSFRLPDVMAASGATLVEVGTTNKTHLRDYENAITPETAAILRVHPSNYKLVGFTSEVPLADLVQLAHARGIVLIADIGAGALIDFSRVGFQPEPTLPDSVAAGSDLVTCSGDKLIGAGQAGIILGRSDLVQTVRKNPIARMVRADKLCLAALEATLSLFLDPDVALREVPTLAMLMRPLSDLAAQAQRIVDALADVPAKTAVVDGFSQMGSGSLPEQNLRTALVSIRPAECSTDDLALALRRRQPPVFARIQDDALLLDPRTLLADDEPILIAALRSVLAS